MISRFHENTPRGSEQQQGWNNNLTDRKWIARISELNFITPDRLSVMTKCYVDVNIGGFFNEMKACYSDILFVP